jgi:hypothetical protein
MVIIQAIINHTHYTTTDVKLQVIKENPVSEPRKKGVKMQGKSGKNPLFWYKKVCRLTKRHTLVKMTNFVTI